MLNTRKSTIPKKPRFNMVRNRAYTLLLHLDIRQFPVDPFCVVDHFPNIKVLKYTECISDEFPDPLYFDKRNKRIDEINLTASDSEDRLPHIDAQVCSQRGADEYHIIYDDRISNVQRIRWTIAHELGHIFCRHLVHFEGTALCRGGLTKEEYGILEIEAHLFASDLLAPRAVLCQFKFEAPNEISLLCDISKSAGEKKFKQLKNQERNYGSLDLFKNFYAHLKSGDYQKVIYENLCGYAHAPFF